MKHLLRASLIAFVGIGRGLDIGDECNPSLTHDQNEVVAELRRRSPDMIVLLSCDDDHLHISSCVPDENSSLGGYCRSNQDILQSSSSRKGSGFLRAESVTADASGTCALAAEEMDGEEMDANEFCEGQKTFGVERPESRPECTKAGSFHEMSSLHRNGKRAFQSAIFPCCLDECCKSSVGNEGACDGAGHMCRMVSTSGPRAYMRRWRRCASASGVILAQD